MKKLLVAGAVATTALLSAPAFAALQTGAAAPEISAKGVTGGKEFDFKLSDALKKGPVVMYFFPAAFTAGCTIETQKFADKAEEFKAAGATLVGLTAGAKMADDKMASASDNLARLAEAMVPLLSDDEPVAIARANEALDAFAPLYRAAWLAGMRAKGGLVREEPEDLALAQDLLAAMVAQRADFTNTFRALSSGETPAGLDAWAEQWNARLDRETRQRSEAFAAMRTVNPAVIPRNHRVEAALAAAEERGDLGSFHELLAAVSRPFTLAANHAHLTEPPPSDFAECYRTFCGT